MRQSASMSSRRPLIRPWGQGHMVTSIWVDSGHGTVKQQPHYVDVTMGVIASQITSLTIVYSSVYSDADQRKHQSSASLVFVRGIHRDRWIPRTKGQLRGKCFHLMTSPCHYLNQFDLRLLASIPVEFYRIFTSCAQKVAFKINFLTFLCICEGMIHEVNCHNFPWCCALSSVALYWSVT